MEKLKTFWNNLPTWVRQVVVLIVGFLFIIAAGLTGWLPGPGGIPLFLIGIAILATEFEWARRLRDKILGWIKQASKWYKTHRLLGTVIIVIAALIVAALLAWYFWPHRV